ncbi:DUF1684 domain-containing protein [bacterium]|nr:MAG: DUF1684 domain-containing protein [bacterium]
MNVKKPMQRQLVFALLVLAMIPALCLAPASCSREPELPLLSATDSLDIVRDNLEHRAEVDSFFRTDAGSPFKRDTAAGYRGIRWYSVDPRFCVFSELHRYDDPETVLVKGTKGEDRRELRYGFFQFVLPDTDGTPRPVKLNVYKFTPYDGQRYLLYRDNLSVWFTDRTTGKETYGVGRYIDVGTEAPDPGHVYRIDFNKAYNPYCAYSNMYSCAVPRKEDHLNIAVRAGELTYH